MGLLTFVKNAGHKLFGTQSADEEKAQKVLEHLKSFDLDTSSLQLSVSNDQVTLAGSVRTIFDKIRVVATAGNVEGIASVNDDALTVGEAVDVNLAPDTSQNFYTVVSGDNLSKISKQFYGNPNLYNKIFEANKPMLKSPDLIYPGQMLVIPAKEA